MIAADGTIHGEETEENRESARRIHACEGISTVEPCRVLSQAMPMFQSRPDRGEDQSRS